jgi:hypothetical protein
MQDAIMRACQCPDCLWGDAWTLEEHRLLNSLLARLDEDHRRWFAGFESRRIGHGGDRLVSLITGMHIQTVRRGRQELDALEEFPLERIRRAGAGRAPLKKKTRPS